MNKRRRTLLALVFCCFPLTAIAQQYHTQLSAAEKEHILDDPFTVVSRMEAIPPNAKQALATMTREQSFEMANPEQKYQVTDVVGLRHLPLRRLVFAGVKDDKWFVHYEKGGRGHGYYVLVFKFDSQGRGQFVWGGSGATGAESLGELRKMVASGQFSDQENYCW